MGNFSILNNLASLNAQNQLKANNMGMNQTLMRLSTGRRINTGADDAAGLQIADSLRANVRALDQAVRNANDGLGVAQIADGALGEVSSVLIRAITLAEQAATETTDSSARASLDAEFSQIEAEMARIADQTNFNGVTLFTTAGLNGTLSIFVGDACGISSISVTINSITTSGSEVYSLGGQNLATVDLTTQSGAINSLTTIRNALTGISSNRAIVGAGMNRLQAAMAVLQNQSQNCQAAESNIRDANIAEEISNMTKHQLLAQSGLAALAQANSNSQMVLLLFGGR